MKQNGIVLNAQQVKEGRRLLRWAAERVALADQVRALLGRGAAFAARFAKAAEMAAPDGFVTRSCVTTLVLAAYGGEQEAMRLASELEEVAWERAVNRPPHEGWTYDAETESCFRLAAAIRFIGS